MRHRRNRIACAAFATVIALFASLPANAAPNDAASRSLLVQSASSWNLGERIRVTAPEPMVMTFTGWYSGLEADSILLVRLSRDEGHVPVHLRQIGMLESSVGSRRHVMAGATVGCLVGLLIGAAVAGSDRDPEVQIDGLGTFQLRGLRTTYIAIGGASGLVLGGAIGYLIRTDRWGFVARFD
jgi:hypothetical protein